MILTDCTSWRTEHVSPVALLTSTPPSRLQVTRADKSRVELRRPQLVGDTIVDGRTRRGTRTRIALNDVEEVAVRKWDPLETTGLVLGVAVLGGIVTLAALYDTRVD
jgi:hypothetical protein